MDEVLELTDSSLELLVLEILNQPLRVSISMFMFMLLWVRGLDSKLRFKEKNIFANSLLGTTIQNGGVSKRSAVILLCLNLK